MSDIKIYTFQGGRAKVRKTNGRHETIEASMIESIEEDKAAEAQDYFLIAYKDMDFFVFF